MLVRKIYCLVGSSLLSFLFFYNLYSLLFLGKYVKLKVILYVVVFIIFSLLSKIFM